MWSPNFLSVIEFQMQHVDAHLRWSSPRGAAIMMKLVKKPSMVKVQVPAFGGPEDLGDFMALPCTSTKGGYGDGPVDEDVHVWTWLC
jgi:hypothetical protein